jgi:beta-glucanase (GH16 family)
MTLSRNYSPLNMLGTAAVLLALAGGCTQNPPGPTITEQTTVKPEAANSDEKAFADYTELAWEEDFNGTSLDPKKWVPEIKDTWYNNEKQATTNDRKNLTVTGGNLQITAVKEAYHGRDYTSARIITKGLKDFAFGRLDIRAKLPKGKGIWPAIWMLGSNDSQVSWPACGEIDIMELRGSQPQVSLTTMHYGASVAAHEQRGTTYALPADDFAADFHVFTVIRSLDKMRFYVDGTQYYTMTPGDVSVYPFNNPFYLILNVAVGGDFDGDPDATTTFPQQMQVDYVKYLKYVE